MGLYYGKVSCEMRNFRTWDDHFSTSLFAPIVLKRASMRRWEGLVGDLVMFAWREEVQDMFRIVELRG